MRPLLVANALLAALAIGCVDGRPPEAERPSAATAVGQASSTPSPGSPAETQPPEPSAIAIQADDVARTPEQQRCIDLADTNRRERPTEHWLTLAAVTSSGDRKVRITHSDLEPGDYFAVAGVLGTGNWGVTLSPVASVGADGKLDLTLTLPPINRCLAIDVGQREPNGGLSDAPAKSARSLPFFPPGAPGSAPLPRACDELPRDIWGSFAARLASISEGPYRVGAPITVSADLPPYPTAKSLDVTFSLVNGRTTSSDIKDHIDTLVSEWNANGRLRYSFTPRANPDLSGLCVQVALTFLPVLGGEQPFAIARFTYP